jgi:predicted dinucleotide-binding enzyme
MKIAILGSGNVGKALATGLDSLNHEVYVGTRDVAETLARDEIKDWVSTHPTIRVTSFADAAAAAELVINAISGHSTISVLQSVGGDNLNHKVLIDISNPLDFTNGMPPQLFVKDTDSLAEMIQREFPSAKVVKTLNTVNSASMIPALTPGKPEFTVFLSGNDDSAKATVTDILRSFGHTDIIDLGGIITARTTEMALPLWMSVAGKLDSWGINFKIVR